MPARVASPAASPAAATASPASAATASPAGAATASPAGAATASPAADCGALESAGRLIQARGIAAARRIAQPMLATALAAVALGCGTESTGGEPPNEGASVGGARGHARDASAEAATDSQVPAAPAAPSDATTVDRPDATSVAPRPEASDAAPVRACPADLEIPQAPSAAPSRVSDAVDTRVRSMIQQMTLAEKAAQLDNTTPAIERIGLPAYQYWSEALHGVMTNGTTSFPVPLALGATWNPDLVHGIAHAISDEARALTNARGNPLTYFSPTINILRDPRWGRSEETYAEDPHLLSRMAVAFVTGMQGDDPKYLKTVATAKHFLANNYEAGRTSTSSDVDERTLREYYLPHFKAAVTEGGAFSVMAAYNAVNGIPMVDQRLFLRDLLRGEWHFPGYVVSDCGAVAYSFTDHRYAKSYASAAALALGAGTDLECSIGERVFLGHLTDAVDAGGTTEAMMDEALLHVLRGRFLLGEFDPPASVPYSTIGAEVIANAEHRGLALRAAREAVVLLKNSSKLLPLDPGSRSLAVVGPYSDNVVLGGYSGSPSTTVSVLSAIRQRLPNAQIVADSSTVAADAARVAASADTAVVVLGTDAKYAAESLDSGNLELPDGQEELANAVIAANPRTVVILMAGAPVTFRAIRGDAPAILYGWYAGQEGGTAVADILFGDVNPSGKLPLTLFSTTEQLPAITNYAIRGEDVDGLGRTYQYFDEAKHGAVLYPFGYGLSYTSFAYEDLELCRTDPQTLMVRVRVTNQSERAGDEIVQLYVRDAAPGVVRPSRALKAFRRVSLAGHAAAHVTFRVPFDDIGYWDPTVRRFVVAPGQLRVEVAASSQDIRLSAAIATDGTAFGL